jgi:hypothetical protein
MCDGQNVGELSISGDGHQSIKKNDRDLHAYYSESPMMVG